MSLPNLPAKDNYRREVRTEWGGINLNENAGDGELIEAMNMSSREYPLLATERLSRIGRIGYGVYRPFVYAPNDPNYSAQFGGYAEVSGAMKIYEGGAVRNAVVNASWNQVMNVVSQAIMQDKLCIYPYKQVYDFSTHTISNIESSFDHPNDPNALGFVDNAYLVSFQDGTYGGVAAEMNTIWCPGVNWADLFSVGDAVTISGTQHNNKTPIIREIDGEYLRFDENTFEQEEVAPHLYNSLTGQSVLPAGDYYCDLNGKHYEFTVAEDVENTTLEIIKFSGIQSFAVTYTMGGVSQASLLVETSNPTGQKTMFKAGDSRAVITRAVPDMDFVCVNENRMWGCKGDTIYCSKQGDPLNWNVFAGISTDSWTVETGTPGSFTGCCSFQGYPTFFKEGACFRILGDEPKNFTLRKVNIVGVVPGGAQTLVEIRGKLYYLSNIGVCEWNGGDYPNIISLPLGYEPRTLYPANLGPTAGTDGNRYFIKMVVQNEDSWANRIMVYDQRFGTWHEQEKSLYVGIAGDGAFSVMLKTWKSGESQGVAEYTTDVYQLSNPFTSTPGVPEWVPDWRVTFADSTRAYKTALTGSESKKGVLRLLIRCKLAGSMKVWIAYDGGEFEQAAEFSSDDGLPKTSRVVPLILRRCDFWQLRLTGTGDAVIYSIAVEKYGGEWQQA